MNPRHTIQTTFWAMVALQTIASVDLPTGKPSKDSPLGGKGTRKLPSPRAYVAVFALWGILSMLAETGAARAAARLSVLVLVTGAVLGPFGSRLVALLETVSSQFAIAPPAPASSPSATPAASPSDLGGFLV